MVDEYCVNNCTKCENLVDSRSQIVNGSGSSDADIMFIGEAPGENEDLEGIPFIGRSGDVLDKELDENGINRDDVRISNIVRCRPADNRDPYVSEIDNCQEYLKEEVEFVEPTVIVPLGRIPTKTILNVSDVSITDISGEKFETDFGNSSRTIVPCIHPAATLYDSSYKELFISTIETVSDITS